MEFSENHSLIRDNRVVLVNGLGKSSGTGPEYRTRQAEIISQYIPDPTIVAVDLSLGHAHLPNEDYLRTEAKTIIKRLQLPDVNDAAKVHPMLIDN